MIIRDVERVASGLKASIRGSVRVGSMTVRHR